MTINERLLCCDWGTSSFRLRLVNTSDYSVIAELNSGDGVADTFNLWQASGSANRFDFYAAKLRSAIGSLSESSSLDLSNLPVIVSGMASSSLGMEEIPYATLPFALDGTGASSKHFPDFNGTGNSLILVSGVKSDSDVMRGEESQLVGLYNFEGDSLVKKVESLFVFPGTHSKHIIVKDGAATGFRTFMTGEIFNILTLYSILKDSISVGGDVKEDGNKSAFISGVKASVSSNLLNALFTVRTNQLFAIQDREKNSFYLSGLLIGTELSELCNGLFKNLVICSGRHLFEHYKIASETLKLTNNIIFIQPESIDKATIAGQVQIFRSLINFYE